MSLFGYISGGDAVQYNGGKTCHAETFHSLCRDQDAISAHEHTTLLGSDQTKVCPR